jgi:hypothetical protein
MSNPIALVQKLWNYDLRTNLHFTLKENTLKRSGLDDFVACYFGAPSSGPARAGSETGAPGAKRNRHLSLSLSSSDEERVVEDRVRS